MVLLHLLKLSVKRIWLEEQFGDKINRKLILTHRKDLVKEIYLLMIDPIADQNILKASGFILAQEIFQIGVRL